MTTYDSLMEQQRSDELADRLAHVFHLWLRRRYPDYVWVRVRGVREWPRRDPVAAVSLSRDLGEWLAVDPDEVDAVAEPAAA